jgi:molybdopterin synthase catalytic subunit/molybdopterin synthase sulfur carrier subunit
LFAAARDAVGAGEVAVDVGDDATVGDVERALVAKLPGLAGIVSHARWAVNAAFCSKDAKLPRAAEVALIPPVSGG